MTTLIVNDFPADLLRRLEALAKDHERSLNDEVQTQIERGLATRSATVAGVRVRAAALRERLNRPPLSVRDIDRSKRLGRP